jgi:hypothetical protein
MTMRRLSCCGSCNCAHADKGLGQAGGESQTYHAPSCAQCCVSGVEKLRNSPHFSYEQQQHATMLARRSAASAAAPTAACPSQHRYHHSRQLCTKTHVTRRDAALLLSTLPGEPGRSCVRRCSTLAGCSGVVAHDSRLRNVLLREGTAVVDWTLLHQGPAAAAAAAAAAAVTAAPGTAAAKPVCADARLDPALAAALMEAVYKTVEQQEVRQQQQVWGAVGPSRAPCGRDCSLQATQPLHRSVWTSRAPPRARRRWWRRSSCSGSGTSCRRASTSTTLVRRVKTALQLHLARFCLSIHGRSGNRVPGWHMAEADRVRFVVLLPPSRQRGPPASAARPG